MQENVISSWSLEFVITQAEILAIFASIIWHITKIKSTSNMNVHDATKTTRQFDWDSLTDHAKRGMCEQISDFPRELFLWHYASKNIQINI